MFIESPADETEEQFRAFVTELIVSIYKRVPDWLEYQVGGRFELHGRFYRQFICPAGSVSGFIYQRATQPGGISRSIVERGRLVVSRIAGRFILALRQSLSMKIYEQPNTALEPTPVTPVPPSLFHASWKVI